MISLLLSFFLLPHVSQIGILHFMASAHQVMVDIFTYKASTNLLNLKAEVVRVPITEVIWCSLLVGISAWKCLLDCLHLLCCPPYPHIKGLRTPACKIELIISSHALEVSKCQQLCDQ